MPKSGCYVDVSETFIGVKFKKKISQVSFEKTTLSSVVKLGSFD